MSVELLYSGYYRGPSTYLDSYTFLKLYPDGRWVFAEGMDPAYDFPGRIKALGVEQRSREQSVGGLDDGGQVVGRLADALEETCGTDAWGRFQVEIVGPGQLKPTTHDVILTFVADEQAEPICSEHPNQDHFRRR